MLLALIEAHIVEDEELGFGTEVGGVGHACRSEIQFGLAGNVAGVAIVALLSDRIDHVGHHNQRRHLGEGVEQVSAGVGDEQHVAFVNGRPAANGRAIHAKTFFKR